MNSYLRNIIVEQNIHPLGYQKIGKAYIVNTKQNRLVIKPNTNNHDIYKYLSSRDFSYFPKHYNGETDNYDMSYYIEDNSLSNEQKVSDLISIIATLHKKTSFKRELDLDEIKKTYEELRIKIDNCIKYYSNLNDYIDTVTFYSPSEYLLIRNISLIYLMLDFCNHRLNTWYENIKNEHSIRYSLIHNNIDIDHLLINDGYYLISWDKSMFDTPISDLYDLYKRYYQNIELEDVIRSYESINKLDNNEYDLLLIKLSLPEEINITKNTYMDIKKISSMLYYLNKVYKLIKKEQDSKNKVNS